MTIHMRVLGALLLVASAAGAQPAAKLSADVRKYVIVPETTVALTNVRVVDGTGAAPREAQTIVIRDGRIASVGPAAQAQVPAGARVMDLANHTVIPGLVGMHNHTFYTTRGRSVQLQFSAPRLYLGTGITTARTTGGTSPYHEINMKRGIDRAKYRDRACTSPARTSPAPAAPPRWRRSAPPNKPGASSITGRTRA
jgi:hypothetical protein